MLDSNIKMLDATGHTYCRNCNADIYPESDYERVPSDGVDGEYDLVCASCAPPMRAF